ncbi:MAG: prefoldin subunit alpha [Promethearchaeota archaeon]
MADEQQQREQYARQLIQSIQLMEEEIARGQSNLQMFQAQATRLAETASAVSELKRHKSGDEVMISIGSGVHLLVNLVNTSHVIVALGAGFAAEKSLEDALASFEKQQEQLLELSRHQQERLREAHARLEVMRKQVSQLVQQ